MSTNWPSRQAVQHTSLCCPPICIVIRLLALFSPRVSSGSHNFTGLPSPCAPSPKVTGLAPRENVFRVATTVPSSLGSLLLPPPPLPRESYGGNTVQRGNHWNYTLITAWFWNELSSLQETSDFLLSLYLSIYLSLSISLSPLSFSPPPPCRPHHGTLIVLKWKEQH